MRKAKYMDEMSWVEFKEVSEITDTVLVPMGSVEQEGLHLPMGTDSIVALEISKRVSSISDVLVAPLINIGYSDWHSGFPGTLSLSMEMLIQVLRKICFDLSRNGFKRFVFVNPHIGNEAPIFSVSTELRRKGIGIGAMINIWKLTGEIGRDIQSLEERVFTHAGEIMTSVMLALRPDLVDMTKAKKDVLKSGINSLEQETSRRVKFKGKHLELYRMSNEVTETGIMGNPINATKEKGEDVINRCVLYIAEFVEEFKKMPLFE